MRKKTAVLFFILLGMAVSAAGQVGVQSFFGDVAIQRSSSQKWEKAAVRAALSAGDIIRTGEHSGAMLYIRNDESVISLSAGSKLMITETMIAKKQKTPGFLLFVGLLKSRIKKNPDEPMDFSTPTAVVGVRGTEFLIAVADDGTSKVGVTRGAVDVQGERNSVNLSSNESSTVALAGDPQDKVLFQGEISDLENWKKTASGRIKGREAEILGQCGRAFEFNFSRIDELDKNKADTQARISALKDERKKLEAAGDAAGSQAKGQEAAALVTDLTRLIVEQNNIDRRNQALFDIAERVKFFAPADKAVTDKFKELKARYDLYHSKFVLTRKKGCL